MAIAPIAYAKFVGSSGNQGGTSGAANASGANTGVLITSNFGGDNTEPFHVTDSNGNTWTRRIRQKSSATGFVVEVFDCLAGTFTNGMTVTIDSSWDGADTFPSFAVGYYSGVDTTQLPDISSSVDGGSHSSSLQCSAQTPSQIGDLLITACNTTDGQSITPPTVDSGFTVQEETTSAQLAEGMVYADLFPGTTSSYAPTWSGFDGTKENIVVLIGYKAAATGPNNVLNVTLDAITLSATSQLKLQASLNATIAAFTSTATGVNALSFVNSGAAAATTLTMPSGRAVGDLEIMCAFRSGSVTLPTVPAGWTTLTSTTVGSGATAACAVIATRVCSSTSDTSGTWTNASDLECQIYRDCLGVGANAFSGAASTTLTYPALTLQNASGDSWVALFGMSRTASNVNSAPTGTTQRSTIGAGPQLVGFDTNGGVSSWAQTTKTINASTSQIGFSIELLSSSPLHAALNSTLAAFTLTGTGTVKLQASLNSTLADFTSSATGALKIQGVDSSTLSDFTLSATAAVKIQAVLTATLDDFTLTATGTVSGGADQGTLNENIDDITLSSAGVVKIQGTASPTLDAFTLSGTGTLKLQGNLSDQLADITSTATGALKIQGALSSTLADFSLLATAALKIQGLLSSTLDDVTVVSAGGDILGGDVTVTLADFSLSASGTLKIQANANPALDAFTVASTAALKIQAVTNITIADVTISATAQSKIHAVVAATLDAFTSLATGALHIVGTLSATIADFVLNAIAVSIPPVPIWKAEAEARDFSAVAEERSFSAMAEARNWSLVAMEGEVMILYPSKTKIEVILAQMDMTPLLDTSTLVDGSTCTIEALSSEGGNPDDILGTVAFDGAHGTIIAELEGAEGVEGCSYLLHFIAVRSDGQTREQQATFKIVKRQISVQS